MARLRRVRRLRSREFAAFLRSTGAAERERRIQAREEDRNDRWPMIPPESIAELGIESFRLTCPGKFGQSERVIGVAYTMPRMRGMVRDPEKDKTKACLFVGRGRDVPCREFPSRYLATAWLGREAEKVKC